MPNKLEWIWYTNSAMGLTEFAQKLSKNAASCAVNMYLQNSLKIRNPAKATSTAQQDSSPCPELEQLKHAVHTYATVVDGIEESVSFVVHLLRECLLRAKYHLSNGS